MKKSLLSALVFSMLLFSAGVVQAHPHHNTPCHGYHQEYQKPMMHKTMPQRRMMPSRPIYVQPYRTGFIGLNLNVGSFGFSLGI